MNIPEVESLSGKGAVFVRGFMEAFYGGDDSLRRCQEAGKLAVEENGETLSIPYISKLSKLLVTSRVVGRKKVGRHYNVTKSALSDEFQAFLEEHDAWGYSVSSTEQDIEDRTLLSAHLEEHHSVRSTLTRRIPKAAYKMMMEKVNRGEYDLAFIPANTKAGVKVDGTTHKIIPMVTHE